MWYFENIPADRHEEVINLFERKEYRKLVEIYNEYKVTSQPLLSCCGFELLKLWTNYAIQTNKISREATSV